MVGELARSAKAKKPQTVSLRVEKIVPDPNQPRKTFQADELRNLAKSLSETAQISPIVVRPGAEGKYVIVVGERRWRAAKQAGMSHIDCIIRYDVSEQEARELQFAENYQREDIPPLEQARGWKQYIATYKVSQSELARRTGIPQRTISDRLTLLSLPASVHARIEGGEIGPYEALKITTLPRDQQEAVAEAVASGQMSGRELENLTRQFPRSSSGAKQVPQSAKVVEGDIGLSQRLDKLEKAIYELVATYAFNEAAKEREQEARRMPPCPECLKRGDRGAVWSVKRKMTAKDHREYFESLEGAELSEEEKAELFEPLPTHIIEAKCHKCGYKEFIAHVCE
jgi:ParB family chromosome partitioning protein